MRILTKQLGGYSEVTILQDINKNGKRKDWKGRKMQSLAISEAFRTGGDVLRAKRIERCGSWLNFQTCPDDHEKKLVGADFCRNPLCPMCMWRKGLLTAHQVCNVAHEALQRHPTLRFLFLTLTVPNVSGDQLGDEITHLVQSHRRLFQRKQVKQAVKGTFRAMEVTYNIDRDDYHPHFHILLAVPPSYFSKNYIKRDDWLKLWQESTRYDNITQVDIRRVKPRTDREGASMAGAAGEVGKYVTKPKTLCDRRLSDDKRAEVVMTLQEAIYKRRLRAYWGMLKEIHRELRLVELDEARNQDMVEAGRTDTGCCCSVCGSEMLLEVYRWVAMEYTRVRVLGGESGEEKVVAYV
jgi:plasmid rolling circle replication initiator protein Rep